MSPSIERAFSGLAAWSDAFVASGTPGDDCPAGDGPVIRGQWAKIETAYRRIWHDDCAESAGAYSVAPSWWA